MVPEPIPVSFANTHSSPGCDHLSNCEQWRAWVRGAPGLNPVGRLVSSAGLAVIRCLRDDVQDLLRAAATRQLVERSAMDRIAAAARSRPGFETSWTRSGVALVPGDGEPAAVICHHLARAALDLLLGAQARAVRTCQGTNCLKIFVSARDDRRWCDSAVCGNRARVSLHNASHR